MGKVNNQVRGSTSFSDAVRMPADPTHSYAVCLMEKMCTFQVKGHTGGGGVCRDEEGKPHQGLTVGILLCLCP